MTPNRKFSFLFRLLLILCISAQAGAQNPFDLKYRKSDSGRSIESVPERKPSVLEKGNDPAPAVKDVTPNTTLTIPEDTPYLSPSPATETDEVIDTQNTSNVRNPADVTGTDSSSAVSSGGQKPTRSTKTGLMLLIILTMALITTLVISSYRQIINKLTRAVLNANYLNLLYREHRSHFNGAYPVLYVIFFVNGGLFIYLSSRFITPDGSAYVLMKCILFLLIIYGMRHLYMKYMGYVYSFDKELSQFDFSIMIFNIVVGLFLLPVNAFMAFGPDMVAEVFMYTGFILIALFYCFRQLRGLLIGSKFLVTKRLYFFLYLCATEIAPLFITIKFFFVFIV